jgi:hypothetical protein
MILFYIIPGFQFGPDHHLILLSVRAGKCGRGMMGNADLHEVINRMSYACRFSDQSRIDSQG